MKSTDPTIKESLNRPIQNLDELPKVTMKHIMTATSSFVTSTNTSKIKGLNTNSKMILCCMMISKEKSGDKMNVSKVIYSLIFNKENSCTILTRKYVNSIIIQE